MDTSGRVDGQAAASPQGDKVFFDRGPSSWAYSLYAQEEGQTDLDEGFLQSLRDIACIYCREFLDAILFVPIQNDYPIRFEDDGVRPTDGGYRERVDAHFKSLYETLDLGVPIVEVQGTRAARILVIADYLGAAPVVLPPA